MTRDPSYRFCDRAGDAGDPRDERRKKVPVRVHVCLCLVDAKSRVRQKVKSIMKWEPSSPYMQMSALFDGDL